MTGLESIYTTGPLKRRRGSVSSIGSQSRYPLIVPRYKEKVAHTLEHSRFYETKLIVFSGFPKGCSTLLIYQSLARLARVLGQGLTGVGLLDSGNLRGRALGHDLSTLISAFRAQINDPVGIADHVQVVLNDND
jgi:hypothetical protein